MPKSTAREAESMKREAGMVEWFKPISTTGAGLWEEGYVKKKKVMSLASGLPIPALFLTSYTTFGYLASLSLTHLICEMG